MSKVESLTYDQAYFAIRQMSRWLRVRERYEQLASRLLPCGQGDETVPQKRQVLVQVAADVDHSSLLFRLLRGREPLEEPPPVEHSYPVYPDWPYVDEPAVDSMQEALDRTRPGDMNILRHHGLLQDDVPGDEKTSEDPDLARLVRELREAAEGVRPKTWWLWDEPPAVPYNGVLALGHACSPETILTLLAALDMRAGAEPAFEYGVALNGDLRDPHRSTMTEEQAHEWVADWLGDGGSPHAFTVIRRAVGEWELDRTPLREAHDATDRGDSA